MDAHFRQDQPVDADDHSPVLKKRLFRLLSVDDLLRAHQTAFIRRVTAHKIMGLRVGIYQCCLDFERGRFVHVMPVNEVHHVEPVAADVPYSLKFRGQGIEIRANLSSDGRKYSISDAFTDVEGRASARVAEAIDVISQPVGDGR